MSVKRDLILGYCPIGNGTSISPFDRVFSKKKDISKGMENVDAVVFWGGSDIHPSYYSQASHIRSQASFYPSDRDKFEWKAMHYCRINKIPMIGVCRGAQFLCAFAGGTLIQHVNGHMGEHLISTKDGELFKSTSCHHQMMYPFDIPHEMLAISYSKQSEIYEDGTNKSISKMMVLPEPEIVYFPGVNGLAIQGHPEWATESRFSDYCNELINTLLLKRKEAVCDGV